MRLRDLVELVRAPAALSVPGDAVAGAAAAGTLGRRVAGLACSSVLLYWAGMAANDWADRSLDAVERPERPIPSGRVGPGLAVGLAAGLTGTALAVAARAGGRRALAVAVPLAAAVWAYDVRAKNTPAGPVIMAACRGLDVLLGATPAATPGLLRAVPAALTVAAHTYTVTALSRGEVRGGDPALPAATLAATATVAATAAGPGGPVPLALASWYASRYGIPQARGIVSPTAESLRAAVAAGIVGLPILQAALVARAGARILGLVVAAAAPLASRLARAVSPT